MGDVTILIGPPGSGKTRDILRRFVKCATHHGHDSVLLLLPTALVVARTRDALMRQRRLPGLFDPRILTFPALAQAILDAGHQPIAPVSDVQRRLLVADVVRSLCEDHQLDALEAASDLPGFPDALCDVFDELKRAAVKPERLRAAVDALFPDDEHARALSVVYAAYQERLAKLNLFDEPGRFWWARDLLRDGKSDFLSGLRLVLVDGFSDFTTTQMQVLALVSGLADETVITLPMEKDQARAELFDAPRATLQSLKQHMPDLQECYLSASEPSGVISAVTRAVFATQPRDDLSNDDCAVRIIAAPGTRAEVEDVAREVKRLLLDGHAQPEDVAIVARRLDDYAQPLRDVFRDFGIPLHLSRPEPASRRPSVQVVLHLLATIAYDYRRSDVADFVRSNFVSLDALQPPKDRISPDDFDRIACEAGIIRGRENWTSHLQAYRKRLEEGLRPSSERDLDEAEDSTSASQARVERVDRTRKLFHALTKRLEPMRCEASRSKHVARLVRLIADFDIPGLLT
ncbi:MAG: PD-(D/E)XK nuclease family protein, partial [Armatimonadota bacterium]